MGLPAGHSVTNSLDLRLFLEAAIAGQLALFAAFLFFARARKSAGATALATLSGAIALTAVVNAVTASGLLGGLRSVNLLLELLLGPMLFVYVRLVRAGAARLARWEIAHCLPAAAGVALFESGLLRDLDGYVLIVLATYTVAAAWVIRRRASYPTRGTYRLVAALVATFGIFVMLRAGVVFEAHNEVDFRASTSYLMILVMVLVLSSFIIWTALRHPDAINGALAAGKYSHSNATPGELDLIVTRLERLMGEEDIYRDPLLDVSTLAGRVRAPPRHVSQAVNARFGVNVAAWVNTRRAEAAARMIREAHDASITTVIHAVGFGSKSAFQREFRKRFGMTPSEYRDRLE